VLITSRLVHPPVAAGGSLHPDGAGPGCLGLGQDRAEFLYQPSQVISQLRFSGDQRAQPTAPLVSQIKPGLLSQCRASRKNLKASRGKLGVHRIGPFRVNSSP